MEEHELRFSSALLLGFFLIVPFKIVRVLSKSRQVETIFLVNVSAVCSCWGEGREKAFPMTVMGNR